MNTSALRVVAAHRPPFVFFNGNRTRADLQFTGMLVDVLPTLLGYARISPTIQYYNAPENVGGSLVNGSWTGVRQSLCPIRASLSCPPRWTPDVSFLHHQSCQGFAAGGLACVLQVQVYDV